MFYVVSLAACTRKNSQVATNLLKNYVRTACSKLLEQVWNTPLTTCNKLNGSVRDLLQHTFKKTYAVMT